MGRIESQPREKWRYNDDFQQFLQVIVGKKSDLVLLLKPRPSYAEKTINKVLSMYVSIEDDYQGLNLVGIA